MELAKQNPINPDFFFPVYKDCEFAIRLITQIKHYYPISNVVGITDGPIQGQACAQEMLDTAQMLGCEIIITDQRLKVAEHGGLWLHRLYEIALDKTTQPDLIRTEGDSYFWRRFKSFPQAEIAGNINPTIPGKPFPRGGCIYLRRTFLEQVVNQRLLLNPIYCNNPDYLYPKYSNARFRNDWDEFDETPVICSDRVQANLLHEMHIKPVVWPDVLIKASKRPVRTSYDGEFAVTHPAPIKRSL